MHPEAFQSARSTSFDCPALRYGPSEIGPPQTQSNIGCGHMPSISLDRLSANESPLAYANLDRPWEAVQQLHCDFTRNGQVILLSFVNASFLSRLVPLSISFTLASPCAPIVYSHYMLINLFNSNHSILPRVMSPISHVVTQIHCTISCVRAALSLLCFVLILIGRFWYEWYVHGSQIRLTAFLTDTLL